MLYDPKWEVQTKPDVFSLESLIAWLEKMPADGSYNWTNCRGMCLLDQYATASDLNCNAGDVYTTLYCSYAKLAYTHPQTFGAALSRARKALAATSPLR